MTKSVNLPHMVAEDYQLKINRLWEQIDNQRIEGIKSVVVKSSKFKKDTKVKKSYVKLKSPQLAEPSEIKTSSSSVNRINVILVIYLNIIFQFSFPNPLTKQDTKCESLHKKILFDFQNVKAKVSLTSSLMLIRAITIVSLQKWEFQASKNFLNSTVWRIYILTL